MNGLDIVFAGFICLGGLLGGKLGLFRSLRSLVGFIFAALLTRWAAPYTVTLLSQSNLDEKISSWIEGKAGINQWQAQYQLWMNDPQVKSALIQQGFSNIADISEQQISLSDAGAQIILLIVSSFILFFVFKLLLRQILKWIENYSNSLPIHRKVNMFGGILSGSLSAAFLSTIVAAIWIPISTSQDISDKSLFSSKESFVVNSWIPFVGLDKYLPLDAATKWLAPMMSKSTPIAQRVNASEFANEAEYTYHGASESKTITLKQWFGGVPTTYEEKELSAKVECKSGSCPDWEVDSGTRVYDCWFCDHEWVGIQGDQFVISSEGSYSSDTLAGCTVRTQGPILNNMKLIEKTENRLIVQGSKKLKKSQLGICDAVYESTVEVLTEWRFYKGK